MIKFLLGLLACFLILVLLAGVLKLVSVLVKRAEPEEEISFLVFETPDYDADITEDEEYMRQDRRVWVSVGALSAPLDDEVYEDTPLYVFFETYFGALKTGDAAALRACYTEECAAALKIPARITQQRVYDILLTLVSSEERTDEEGVKCTESVYRFEYKIMKNDGVFRRDLESGAVKPQLVTLREYPDTIRISDVIGKYIIQGEKS
ncbi:MAG: hypothetical protein IJR89_07885 [Clostridia bacterium]|nr:hypothetical protein [Clostridia bacterium]